MLGFSPLAAAPLADDVGLDPNVVTVFLTSGTSWTVPSNWNNSLNSIEVIGAGGSGAATRSAGARYATGGGAGGYSKVTNVTLSGTIPYTVGAGGTAVVRTSAGNSNGNAGTATFFGAATQVASVVAANGGGGGIAAQAGTAAGGIGASTTGAIGSKKYAGGSGGAQTVSSAVIAFSSGGGGAGGPKGAGNNGVSGSTDGQTNGGSGGAGFGGTAGSGTNGGNGSDILSAYGSGGGGGGYRTPDGSGTYVGFAGGTYGGAGGGITITGGTITSGAGAQGVIVIRYVPAAAILTASNITAGAPEVGTPTAGTGFGTVGITAGAPVVDTATIAQTHALSAAELAAGTVTVGVSSLGQLLISVDITATLIVGTSSIQQTHVLTSVGIEATPTVSESTMVVIRNMVPTDVVAGATVVATPDIAQTHKFTSTDVVNGRIIVPVPTLRQKHVLSSVGMQAQPVFMPPGPRLRNLWATNAVNIVAGNPVLTAAIAGMYTPSSRGTVVMEFADQPKPVQDWTTKVYIVGGSNQVVLQIDATTVEIYGGPNTTDADNANSITGAYVGQTHAE